MPADMNKTISLMGLFPLDLIQSRYGWLGYIVRLILGRG
jgi:hypothetical protein